MKRFTRISFLFCVVGILLLFTRTATFSFIGLDDAAYTFRNPFVAGGLSLGNGIEAFTNLRHGGIWMPVTYMSYMFDTSLCRLTGLPLVGEMHVVNVLLHVANFLLLWKLLTILFVSRGRDKHDPPNQLSAICLFAAVLWAVHPLRVEPVAWIAARKELLWTFFTLVGLICWIKALALNLDTPHPSTLNPQLITLVCCSLACLSKPTAMCFPFLALLVAWWMGHHGSKSISLRLCVSAGNRRVQLTLVILFLLAFATAVIAAYSQTHVAGRETASLYAVPFMHRLVNALSAMGFYLKATVWPFGLHVDCRSVAALWPLGAGWNLAALGIALTLLAYLALTSLLAHSPSHHSPSHPLTSHLFTFTWFLFSLLPTLGIFGSFGIEAHADRFAYLPSMAFSFLIVWFFGIRHVADGSPNPTGDNRPPEIGTPKPFNRLIFNLLAFILILLSVLTFNQLGFWRDDATAHQRALACDPEHPRAMVHVADARCSRQRDFDGGIRLYRHALARADTVPKGGFDVEDVKAKLAYALATRGRQEDFAEVKRIGAAVLRDTRLDRRGLMLDALGTAILHDGDFERAASLFRASLDAPDRFWPKASTQRKLETLRR